MVRTVVFCVAILLMAVQGSFGQSDGNWPHWRGPNHNGISNATDLPSEWSPTKNIKWKLELPSWSAATPIIWGDRVFVTSPSKVAPNLRSKTQGRDPGGSDLLLFCISKQDGKVLWQRKLDEKNEIHNKQNDSTPSPVTDGNHVWVVTGTGIVTSFDMNGNQVWRKNLQTEYIAFGHNWGYGSSPLLHDGSLIIEVLHGMKTDEASYIVCLNAETGEQEWYQERPTDARRESPDAYTTPVVLEHDGQVQIVISGGDYVTGHDRKTGKELWRAAGLNPMKRSNYRIVGTPIVVNGIIIVPSRQKPVLALRAGGEGDITLSNLLWKYEGSGTSDVPSPISDGKYLYLVDDRGLVTCLNLENGTVIWGPEKAGTGIVSASPIIADGKMYVLNEKGVTTIVTVGDEFEVIGTNELDGTYTLASPAVSGSNIFIRTSTHLYCIGN